MDHSPWRVQRAEGPHRTTFAGTFERRRGDRSPHRPNASHPISSTHAWLLVHAGSGR